MDLLEKMATYVRVVECGSFSAAAQQLRVSPAAVSRQISTLEAELEVSLLTRTTRKMMVTPEGRRYFESCLGILRQVDDAQAMGKKGVLAGSLKVSAPVSYGLLAVVPTLPTLMRAHPGLVIDLRIEDFLIDLAFEGVDVAIRVGAAPPDSADLIAHKVDEFRRVAVASPKYLARKALPKTPAGLTKLDVLGGAPATGRDVWTFVREGEHVRVALQPIFRSNALLAMHSLVREGLGVAVFPEWFVKQDLERKLLREVLPGWKSPPIPVHALHRVETRGAHLVRAFVEHLKRR